jgi:succinoglycan biosynthesis protein ExoL
MLRLYSVDPDPAMIAKIVYFAHDLSDPTVHRLVRMLVAGGAAVTPIGFRRSAEAPNAVEGLSPIDLGQTADGMLGRRMLSVVGALVRLGGMAEHLRHANVILARNLEMLVLAIRARKRYAPQATVVYECLDIHRMLLSNRLHGRLFRSLESKLWRDVDLLLTSSPAFIRNYFAPRGFPSPIRLVENKVPMIGERETGAPSVRPPPGPPWRIGWFGMIRSRKSFDILSSLARAADGGLDIVIRGRPSAAIFHDFEAAITDLPHVHFAGPYRNPAELAAVYGDVHFNWAVEYYESGQNQNSSWLLPNRIYEGSLYGSVPIASAAVETGRWLTKRGIGVVLDEPLEPKLIDFFQRLDHESYFKLVQTVEALPRSELVSSRSDCRELVEALCRPSAHGVQVSSRRARLAS